MTPPLKPWPKTKMQPKPPRKYMPKVNVKRAKVRRARDYGDIAEWLVTLPCCVCGKKTGEIDMDRDGPSRWEVARGTPFADLHPVVVQVVAAHAKSRGSGGRSKANLLPLAWHLHERQHAQGWESIGLTKEKAKQLAVEYEELFERTFATSDETGDDTK